MDAATVVKLAGVALSLGAGHVSKSRLRLNHKAAGPTQNVVLGQGVALLGELVPGIDLDYTDGLQVAAATELVYQGGKSIVHAVGTLRRLFRRR